jgi:hypothetical protein
VASSALSAGQLTDAAEAFEARFEPQTAVAAAFAAVPPILFWARIAIAEQRRQREAEAKEEARKVTSWAALLSSLRIVALLITLFC